MNFCRIILLFFCVNIVACQSIDEEQLSKVQIIKHDENFDSRLTKLVNHLISNERYQYRDKITLVTTFVWLDSLSYKEMVHPLQYLGHQLAEGIKTELVQKNVRVVEHKSSTSVAMAKKGTYFLSRDVTELAYKSNAHYIIAGTIIEMEGGAMVNAEAVDVATNEVIGAAREFFPDSTFGNNNRAIIKDGKLYRTEQ